MTERQGLKIGRWWRLAAALIALVDKVSRIGVAVQGNFHLLSMCDLSLAAEAAVLASSRATESMGKTRQLSSVAVISKSVQ